MIKDKFGNTKNSINGYKDSNGVSDTEMASMYDLPSDISLEEKDESVTNKSTVKILNDKMANMYNLLKNK